MTNLPAIVESAALSFARERVATLSESKIEICGVELSMFNKADNHRLGVLVMKNVAMSHPLRMMTVVDFARQGWDLAHEALSELLIEFDDRNEEKPTYLKAYGMEITRGWRPRKKPARKKSDQFLRDIAIVAVVGDVAERFKLHPTRSPASRGKASAFPSACSVTAKALGVRGEEMNEDNVVAIWQRYGPMIYRRGFPFSPAGQSL